MVSLIVITFYLHDDVIAITALNQAGIKAEQEYRQLKNTNKLYDKNTKARLERLCEDYIKQGSIMVKNTHVDIQQTNNTFKLNSLGNFRLFGLISENVNILSSATIKENNPPDYIRRINALKEMKSN